MSDSSDRNHQQLAANDLRALLIPQRDLLRDARLLVDPVHDLLRTVHETLLRKPVHDELSVVLAVHPRRHPRREIVLSARRERRHVDELRIRLARQPQDDVPHERARVRRGPFDARVLPLILAVIERVRLHHVIRSRRASSARETDRPDSARARGMSAGIAESGLKIEPKIAAYVRMTGSPGSARYASTVPSYASITTFTLLRI